MENAAIARPSFPSVRKIIALFTATALLMMLVAVTFVYKQYKPKINQKGAKQVIAQHIQW
ncbi:hypothetical protein A3J43_04190 [Candidatus Uhrbacteria bacterium RIFCSPHIGHO2_12_FULL_54_23]|uniref:Uncharacterized protein n=1 Tax=Candidatus Uhrbacteria bacterium RIFCSPHIGHO2_12_FULL_54_23 TaxID=1802397 RepID=A0A1F7UK57_9BACT|nr:MAG: hypothetical protein A3J43_04190 [Candidatus Uhrbacteria bacterium RIFCSPHIGHO2_12_FULL_54_23]